jgi:uracil permease
MKKDMLLGVRQRPKFLQWLVLSLQHVFAMFGATVLVPLLTGLDVGVALVASGVGTIIYIVCTKAKVPVYLGSSFAYIGAIAGAVAENNNSSAYFGLMLVGLIYVVIAVILHYTGTKWLKKLLAPVVVGPMIIIIGLSLAPVAVGSAGLDGQSGWQIPLVALITFATVVGVSVVGKGFFKIVPFLIAVLVGYAVSIPFGLVDLDAAFNGVQLFQLPEFDFIGTYSLSSLEWLTVFSFAPIALVTIAEHIGDHTVISEITGEDFIVDPGLDKTLLGDGLATAVAGAIGGPANTSYSENIGVIAVTKSASVWVTGLAAVFAILLGFIGPVQAFVNSIPWAVIGGMSVILYGLISANGVRVMVNSKVDFGSMRNLIIVATMLVLGLGGAFLSINGSTGFGGMSLAVIVGVILNLILPEDKKENKKPESIEELFANYKGDYSSEKIVWEEVTTELEKAEKSGEFYSGEETFEEILNENKEITPNVGVGFEEEKKD